MIKVILSFVCSVLCSYWLLPALVLKRMVMGNFERGSHDAEMSDAIDFVVDCVSNSVPSFTYSNTWTLVWDFRSFQCVHRLVF